MTGSPDSMLAIASLVFANPVGAAGLIAIALPVLAHLWHRRTGPPTPFTNVAMVERCERHAARRDRWRDMLLLALRCAVIASIVAAFMQPGWSSTPTDDTADTVNVSAGSNHIIVLDASGSMQRTVGGRSLFERARARALKLAEQQIAAGGRVSIIEAGRSPQALLTQPTALAGAIRAALGSVACSIERADLTAAVAMAFDQARRDRDRATVVHVITDDQAASWSAEPIAPPANVSMRFHRIDGAPLEPQLALADAGLVGPPPVVGEPFVVTANVLNPTATALPAMVRMRCNGVNDTRSITVPATGATSVSFVLTFNEPGVRVLQLSLPDDALALDNHAGVRIDVQPAVDVWLHTVDDVNDDRTAAYYLLRAIAPTAGGRYRVRVVDSLGPSNGADGGAMPDVLVISSTNAMRLDAMPTLERWQEAGIGMVRFVEPRAGAATRSAIVPVDRELDVWRAFDPAALATLMRSTLDVGALDLAQHGLTPVAESNAGRPIIASRTTATQRDVLINASIDPATSDIVRSPAFAGLMQQLLRHVEPRRAGRADARAGDTVTIALPAGAGAADAARVIGPTGARVPFNERTLADQPAIDMRAPPMPGGYAVVNSPGRAIGGFVVGFDTGESDLTPGRPPIAEPPTFQPNTAATATVRDPIADAAPLWPWLVALALIVGATELGIAHMARRATHNDADAWQIGRAA